MAQQKDICVKTVIRILSTFFYLGYAPLMPGTIGSMGGLIFYFIVKDPPALYFSCLAGLILIEFFVVSEAEKIFGKADSARIVIDEAAGMMTALLFIPQKTVFILTAFAAFRLFDITKPFPIKRLEKIASPWGVILDDIAAGLYANFTTQLVFILAVKMGA
ncbi:MAG: phosphatidylglycerophosphatase A [Candidatus Omnitrophota bacterium]